MRRFVFVFAVVSCGVGSLDLAGKQCPCVDEWVCDTATDTCVLETPATGPMPGPEVAAPPPPPPGGTIMVSDLEADWVTPNTIRWSWAVSGNPAEFGHYELVTGPNESIVTTHVGARAWSPTNPELKEFAPRISPLPAAPFRVWTITQEHVPGTTTWAEITAIDVNGRGQAAKAVTAKTSAEATDLFTIFQDTALPGAPEPNATQFTRVTSGAFGTSSHCYLYTPQCPATQTQCQDLFGQLDLARTLTTLSQAEFNRAFVEFQMRASALVPTEYVTFALQVGLPACGTGECRYRINGLSLTPNDTYRVFQIPLKKLLRSNDPRELDIEVFRTRMWKLHGILWSATWSGTAQVRVDEIKIRW
jgi:hypothetical protein